MTTKRIIIEIGPNDGHGQAYLSTILLDVAGHHQPLDSTDAPDAHGALSLAVWNLVEMLKSWPHE